MQTIKNSIHEIILVLIPNSAASRTWVLVEDADPVNMISRPFGPATPNWKTLVIQLIVMAAIGLALGLIWGLYGHS